MYTSTHFDINNSNKNILLSTHFLSELVYYKAIIVTANQTVASSNSHTNNLMCGANNIIYLKSPGPLAY